MNKKLIILSTVLVLGLFLISSCQIKEPVGKKLNFDQTPIKTECKSGPDSGGCCYQYCQKYCGQPGSDNTRRCNECEGFCIGRY